MKTTHPTLDQHFRQHPPQMSALGLQSWGVFKATRTAPSLVMRTTFHLMPALGGKAATLVIDRGMN